MSKTMKTFDHAIKPTVRLLCVAAAFGLAACDPGLPEASSGFSASGYAAPLSQAEFNTLPPEEQYQVASKLYGTLFRGISAEDFYNLDAGTTTLSPKSSTFLDDTRKALKTTLTVAELSAADTLIEGFDEEGNPTQAALGFARCRARMAASSSNQR